MTTQLWSCTSVTTVYHRQPWPPPAPCLQVQLATVAALGEISRHISGHPSVMENLTAVYDNLLDCGEHELQLAVMRALGKMAAGGCGGRQQLEYVVQRVQLVLLAMQSSLVGKRSEVQLQELAAVILSVLQAAHGCEVGGRVGGDAKACMASAQWVTSSCRLCAQPHSSPHIITS